MNGPRQAGYLNQEGYRAESLGHAQATYLAGSPVGQGHGDADALICAYRKGWPKLRTVLARTGFCQAHVTQILAKAGLSWPNKAYDEYLGELEAKELAVWRKRQALKEKRRAKEQAKRDEARSIKRDEAVAKRGKAKAVRKLKKILVADQKLEAFRLWLAARKQSSTSDGYIA